MKTLWNGKMEKVDLSGYGDFDYDQQNIYCLEWFELMKYREKYFVIYGVGQWWNHLMDWRGCNFYHGRLPKSPVFESEEDAKKWLKFQVENGVYQEKMELTGHHDGDPCLRGCRKRELETIYFTKDRKSI